MDFKQKEDLRGVASEVFFLFEMMIVG